MTQQENISIYCHLRFRSILTLWGSVCRVQVPLERFECFSVYREFCIDLGRKDILQVPIHISYSFRFMLVILFTWIFSFISLIFIFTVDKIMGWDKLERKAFLNGSQ